MRILHVVHTPRFSGAEMLVLALTKLHTSTGHPSAVVAMFPPEADFNTKIAEQKRLGIEWFAPERSLSRVERLAFLRNVSRKYCADVVFAHSVLPAAYARVAFLNNVISVLHAENNYDRPLVAIAEKLLQYQSAGVVTVSAKAKIHYIQRYRHPEIKCIPNGISLSKYQNPKSTSLQKTLTSLGLSNDSILALQVGRVNGVKQQHLSIKAITPLIEVNKNIHLLLAGIFDDKAYLKIVKKEIDASGQQENIHLLGPRDDVPELLKLANIYLMPSKQEAHSVALIEAMASGVEIIASNIAAFEYVTGIEGVTLVNPNNTNLFSDAIGNAIQSKTRYKHDLAAFDIECTAKLYIEFAISCTGNLSK